MGPQNNGDYDPEAKHRPIQISLIPIRDKRRYTWVEQTRNIHFLNYPVHTSVVSISRIINAKVGVP
jgi:hypothetical protein